MTESINSIREKLTSTELAVRYILAHFPKARSNDKLLLLLFWELVDKIPMTKEFKQAFLTRATTPETITRARRLIQSSGEYQPTEEIREYRESRKKKMRELLKGQSTLLPT